MGEQRFEEISHRVLAKIGGDEADAKFPPRGARGGLRGGQSLRI